MDLTRNDVTLVRMLASAAKHAPAKMHAEYLAEQGERLAVKLEAMVRQTPTAELVEDVTNAA